MIRYNLIFVLLCFLYCNCFSQISIGSMKVLNNCDLKDLITYSNYKFSVDYLFAIKDIQKDQKINFSKNLKVFANDLNHSLVEEKYLLKNEVVSISKKKNRSDILYIKVANKKIYFQFKNQYEFDFLGYNINSDYSQLFFKLKSEKCNAIISVVKWKNSNHISLTQFDSE